ncbi:DDE domain-containing protein [Streptomyces sp. TM32]|uniref:DDE-type integrase/transposase/recombinase n=1 Tax=Streptomyces sp. TM32 TaxID=1652669 RepID=UPI001011A4F9|nr:DDE-type integrase/transposase/recombinase [Streptomyces sp. TM32]RXS83406.1 DDE domain-containing protein [Streptomyces sp. TM32]
MSPSYEGFRYPAEAISHCVWLYHRNWQYLWRAMDLEGNALDILVRSRRNTKAVEPLLAGS